MATLLPWIGNARIVLMGEATHGTHEFYRWRAELTRSLGMWRNAEVVEWLAWLRQRNGAVAEPSAHVGFFGLDLYSLRDSMHAVLDYLGRVDPTAAERARAHYACFDELADDPQAYGHAVQMRRCTRDWRTNGCSGPSASSTGPRRNGGAITSARLCQGSSMHSSTWT